jgi:hypothetical protein
MVTGQEGAKRFSDERHHGRMAVARAIIMAVEACRLRPGPPPAALGQAGDGLGGHLRPGASD